MIVMVFGRGCFACMPGDSLAVIVLLGFLFAGAHLVNGRSEHRSRTSSLSNGSFDGAMSSHACRMTNSAALFKSGMTACDKRHKLQE